MDPRVLKEELNWWTFSTDNRQTQNGLPPLLVYSNECYENEWHQNQISKVDFSSSVGWIKRK